MSSLDTIIAGIEHLASADPVLAAAAALARWSGAELHLLHAYHAFPGPGAPARHGEELRARLAAAAAAIPGGERAVCHAVRGSASDALLQTAGEIAADLVVVGAGGRHVLLGSTAGRVLRSAAAPVLVVRRPVQRPLGRLLLATDLSELSAAAHERGLDVAGALFGDALAVRAVLVMGSGNLPAPLPEAALARAEHSELRRYLRARRPRPGRVEPSVRTGSPAEEVVAEADAWNADLLVVGTHGRVLLGSTAEAVLRHASCNVLAVPTSPAVPYAGGEAPASATVPWAGPLAPAAG
jgi:nucleotide-binding universal stress UspA family protein